MISINISKLKIISINTSKLKEILTKFQASRVSGFLSEAYNVCRQQKVSGGELPYFKALSSNLVFL